MVVRLAALLWRKTVFPSSMALKSSHRRGRSNAPRTAILQVGIVT